MSYSVCCKFYANGKFHSKAVIDRLKSLNDKAYSADMPDVSPDTSGVTDAMIKNATKEVYSEFAFFLDPKIHEALPSFFMKAPEGDEADWLIKAKDLIKAKKYEVDLGTMEESLKADTSGYQRVYVLKDTTLNGEWYSFSSFSKAEDFYIEKYNKLLEKKLRLETIKMSKDFYMLSEEQQSNLQEDLSYASEDLADAIYPVYACSHMAGILEFLENEKNLDDTDYSEPDKEIRVFIYAS